MITRMGAMLERVACWETTSQRAQEDGPDPVFETVSVVGEGPKDKVGDWGLTTPGRRWVLVVKPKWQGNTWEGIYREGLEQ